MYSAQQRSEHSGRSLESVVYLLYFLFFCVYFVFILFPQFLLVLPSSASFFVFRSRFHLQYFFYSSCSSSSSSYSPLFFFNLFSFCLKLLPAKKSPLEKEKCVSFDVSIICSVFFASSVDSHEVGKEVVTL